MQIVGSLSFYTYLLGGTMRGLGDRPTAVISATSNLCCVIHSSLQITFTSRIFLVMIYLPGYNQSVSCCQLKRMWTICFYFCQIKYQNLQGQSHCTVFAFMIIIKDYTFFPKMTIEISRIIWISEPSIDEIHVSSCS